MLVKQLYTMNLRILLYLEQEIHVSLLYVINGTCHMMTRIGKTEYEII